MQSLQRAFEGIHILEEFDGFIDGHFEDIGDGFSFEVNGERLAIESLPDALWAWDIDVLEEAHLEFLSTLAGACVAATVSCVEAKSDGVEAALLCVSGGCINFTDVIPKAAVGGRYTARRASDGGLVDLDKSIDLVCTGESLPMRGGEGGAREGRLDGSDERVMDEGAFAASADTGNSYESPQGEFDADIPKVVFGDT